MFSDEIVSLTFKTSPKIPDSPRDPFVLAISNRSYCATPRTYPARQVYNPVSLSKNLEEDEFLTIRGFHHKCHSWITGKPCTYFRRKFTEVAELLAPAIRQNQRKFTLEIWCWGPLRILILGCLDVGDMDEICKEILGLEPESGSRVTPRRRYVTSSSTRQKNAPRRDLV